ncbi:hypothetical protein V6N13_075414 [Hibiscus sabdariffa]|uniref:Cytochrome c oxidase subunit 6b-1 n=1 Tax=Hibiscus sabdariffa TaxID=183260 RepID=A0ABR2UBW4_9ROSI
MEKEEKSDVATKAADAKVVENSTNASPGEVVTENSIEDAQVSVDESTEPTSENSAAKGEDAPECDKFAKYYRALCPGEWIDRWNEQREKATFPGPL